MEYWDVTVWLDSGERLFARFLVTNQGPGNRTAAAVGHLVLGDGRTVPFRWGRREGAWTLGPSGASMRIGKATLDLSGSAIVVAIDSKKHGIEARLEIDRRDDGIRSRPMDLDYEVEVAVPRAARGTITTDPARGARTVAGSGAVTHTSFSGNEGDRVRRRDELLLRNGTQGLYVSSLVLADGTRRTSVVPVPGLDDTRTRFPTAPAPRLTLDENGADGARFPLASAVHGDVGTLRFDASIGPERLRMNPLEILPQPFRLLMSLAGEPQRVWADAKATVTRVDRAEPVELSGVFVSTFSRPER